MAMFLTYLSSTTGTRNWNYEYCLLKQDQQQRQDVPWAIAVRNPTHKLFLSPSLLLLTHGTLLLTHHVHISLQDSEHVWYPKNHPAELSETHVGGIYLRDKLEPWP